MIFPSPKDGITLVKRVVGLPGETVEMRDERLFIDGRRSTMPRRAKTMRICPGHARSSAEIVAEKLAGHASDHDVAGSTRRANVRAGHVPDGHYLVLGDNRDNSEDSRYIGFIARDSIYGRAFGVAYSLDADRWYRPRFDRTFSSLR